MSDEWIEITRDYDATPERLFTAWTDPAQFKQWFGPQGMAIKEFHSDLQVGGKWRYCMANDSGFEMWLGGEYLEIVPGARLVTRDHMADADGNAVDPQDKGMAGWPMYTEVVREFSTHDGKGRMVLRHGKLPDHPGREGAKGGWIQAAEKLAAHLASTG